MENSELVSVYSFCVNHQIDFSFIESLEQYGLVEIITREEQAYIEESRLAEIEKFVRLHYELDINLEGIEAIGHLLEKIKDMQARNLQLQNRLGLYEEGSLD
jgi:chaperone modulatory protein CbpM